MQKTIWYEVYHYVDNDPINGTETLAEFSTISEALNFIGNNPNYYIDKWECNEDGSGIGKRLIYELMNELDDL